MPVGDRLFIGYVFLYRHNRQGRDSLTMAADLQTKRVLEDRNIVHGYHLNIFKKYHKL